MLTTILIMALIYLYGIGALVCAAMCWDQNGDIDWSDAPKIFGWPVWVPFAVADGMLEGDGDE